MADVIRRRTISPETRQASSKSYKVTTKTVVSGDTLVVNIDHATRSFNKQFKFSGSDVANRDSISFRVNEDATHIQISWSGASPINESESLTVKGDDTIQKNKIAKEIPKDGAIESLEPIADQNSKVLVLGTMPGEESLKQQAYYSNSRNLFWKLLSSVLEKDVPEAYEERKEFLLENNIAVWDMCQSCFREGSLDSNISEEMPNDIVGFVKEHATIKAIAFNGLTAAKIYARHIGSIDDIRLISLPSTSPANASVSWDEKVENWEKISEYLN